MFAGKLLNFKLNRAECGAILIENSCIYCLQVGTLWEPVYDIFVLGSMARLPVWFYAWRLIGQGAVWKGCAGKTMHARKKLPPYKMFGWSSSFWRTKPKKVSTLFRWVYWVKTGMDLLFFCLDGSLRSFKAVQNLQTYRVCC